MKSGAVKPSLGLGGGSDCWDEGSGPREMSVHNAPMMKIEISSIIRRLEIKADLFVLDFMLCILEL